MPATGTWSGSFQNHLIQWPVGHGGFFTQEIEFHSYPASQVSSKAPAGSLKLIYDCGSGTGKPRSHIVGAIDRYLGGFDGHAIDLLVISHFDADHVNGLSYLAGQLRKRKIKVRRVWAPLLEHLDRLELALAVNESDDDSGEIRRIILTPERQIREMFPDADLSFLEHTPEERGQSTPIVPDLAGDETPTLGVFDSAGGRAIGFRGTGPMLPEVLWEVCSYVTPSTKAASSVVDAQFRNFMNKDPKDCTIDDLVKIANDRPLLKNFHDAVTAAHRAAGNKVSRGCGGGTGPNLSSVCVYSGPARPYSWNRNRGWGSTSLPNQNLTRWCLPVAPAWLGTGDGVFTTPHQVDEMKAAFGAERFDRVGVMSAPHHGSKYDCCADLWQSFPNLAVVTLEGDCGTGKRDKRRCHPHLEVLNELASQNLHAHVAVPGAGHEFELRDRRYR